MSIFVRDCRGRVSVWVKTQRPPGPLRASVHLVVEGLYTELAAFRIWECTQDVAWERLVVGRVRGGA